MSVTVKHSWRLVWQHHGETQSTCSKTQFKIYLLHSVMLFDLFSPSLQLPSAELITTAQSTSISADVTVLKHMVLLRAQILNATVFDWNFLSFWKQTHKRVFPSVYKLNYETINYMLRMNSYIQMFIFAETQNLNSLVVMKIFCRQFSNIWILLDSIL